MIRRHWRLILALELIIAMALIGVIAYIHINNLKAEEETAAVSGAKDNGSASDTASVGSGDADPSDTAAQTQKTDGNSGKTATQYTVFVETGHGTDENGNWDTGCTWSDGTTEYVEADVMLPIAKSMVKYLRDSGVTVITDADSGNDSNLFAALDYMETHQVDAFVNLHCDYEGADSGTMPLYRTDEQKALGLALSKGVHEYIDIPDRGPQYREDLDTLNSEKPKCPAVLFETGCISSDNKILTTQYDEYGKGLAKGMCDFLGIRFHEAEK